MNRQYIDHVQITVAETVGLEGRGGYYDHSGALRDMVQNHLLQVLCLVAMEPPARLANEAVRNEKLKVLQALAPIAHGDVLHRTVRGQYRAGAIQGTAVVGYRDEPGIAENSDTETFVCLKAEVQNWRWAGMPFYLRTGKRLATKASEIVIHFRPVPHSIFPGYPTAQFAAESTGRARAAQRRHAFAYDDQGAGAGWFASAPVGAEFELPGHL